MNLEAFILTGGRSTRMGSDKASLELDGITLADRAVSIARTTNLFSRVRVVGPSLIKEDAVADRFENRGPLGGLHAALNAAETDWIFLLAGDLPFVTPELIACLSSFRGNAVDAVVPFQSEGRAQPLCAFYRVEKCLPAATRLLERRDDAALRDILDEVRSRKVAFEEISNLSGSQHFFRNINTPDDLEEARRVCALTPVVAK
jgi:molybdenum cofactor guanylyltransferase